VVLKIILILYSFYYPATSIFSAPLPIILSETGSEGIFVTHPITIIGGNIRGLSAARHLARKGIKDELS